MRSISGLRDAPKLPWIVATAAAVVFATSAAAWFWGVAPAQAAAADASLADAQVAQAELSLAKARTRLGDVQQELDELAERTLLGPAPGEFDRRNERLAGLLGLAEDAGLEVLRIDPGEPAPAGGHAEVEIELEGVGTFPEHHQFLGVLHGRCPDLIVRGFHLQRRGDARIAAGYRIDWIVAWPLSADANDAGGQP